MSYYNTKLVDLSFDKVIEKVTEELKKEGFGILSEIDVRATLKKKLDVDFRNYKILGACNPPFAYKALQVEENIGVLLPCNFIVQERTEGGVQISAVNPMESMKAVKNPQMESIAAEISGKIKKVLENL